MKKFSFILFLFFCSISFGQGAEGRFATVASQSELGIYGGGASYLGDLNPFNPFREVSGALGLTYRYNLNMRFALRGNLTFLRVNASDAKSKEYFLRNRNLNFRNDIFEVAFGGEINFFNYRQGDFRKKTQRVYMKKGYSFTPYLFLQIAYFYHNPKGLYNGKYIELSNLGTEGQGLPGGKKPYKKHQVSFPFGVGFKFNIAKGVTMSLEWAIRLTTTDYIDDVSGDYADAVAITENNGSIAGYMSDRTIVQYGPGGRNTGLNRGTGSKVDWYQTFGAMISFRLGKGKKCQF